ncbi:hypothetical protein ACIPRI_23455 [Variovorax sp. LARHSF232]
MKLLSRLRLGRLAVSQRERSVDRGHRVHGVSHITIIEVLGLVRRGRPVLRVLLTFTR